MGLYRPTYRDKATGEQRVSQVWWYEYQHAGKRHLVNLKVRDKRVAMIKAGDVRKAIELRAVGLDTKHETRAAAVGDLLAEYKGELERRGRSKAHVALTHSRLTRTLEGVERVADATPERLRGALQGVAATTVARSTGQRGVTAKTANYFRVALHGFFAWLVREGRWSSNPVDAIPRAREVEATKKRRALTPEELARLLAAAPPLRSALVRLAATTGLRRAELKALTWAQLDLVAGTVTARASTSKNRRETVLPLASGTVAALAALKTGAQPGDHVFRPFPTVLTFYRDLVRAGLATKGKGRRSFNTRDAQGTVLDFHALRVTFATSLARADVPLALAQRLMRHSTPVLTANVYTRLELHDGRDAVARIDVDAAAIEAVRLVGKLVGPPVVSVEPHRLTATGTDAVSPVVSLRNESGARPQSRAPIELAGVHGNRTHLPGCSPGTPDLKSGLAPLEPASEAALRAETSATCGGLVGPERVKSRDAARDELVRAVLAEASRADDPAVLVEAARLLLRRGRA